MKPTNKELQIKEPLYFYITRKWYTGKMPHFYDVSDFESKRVLESNYESIKEEIVAFFESNDKAFKPNYTPYKYKEDGWRTINLRAFLLEYPDKIKLFPKLYKTVNEIPDVLTIHIAVLDPHTRVKAHFGDTNAIIRNHLGIIIPGKYPDLGFRNGVEERCWEEGKVLAICVAHRHYVWNNTDKKRLILMVDTIHPKYKNQKYWICSGLLAASFMKSISNNFEFTKKFPKFIIHLIHKTISFAFLILLRIQNFFKIYPVNFLSRFKVDV